MKNNYKLLISNQIYFLSRKSGFWVCSFLLLSYVMVTFMYYCLSFWGKDAASTLDASEMYAFNGNAPFWQIFVYVVPLLCCLNCGCQNAETIKNGTHIYVYFKVSSKEYVKSMAYANLLLTFIQFEVASLISMVLNRIAFYDTGVFFEGVKGASSYWRNIKGEYSYHCVDFHMAHPWLYEIVFSIFFSCFCMIITYFLFAVSLYIKKNGLWIFVIAALLSYVLYEVEVVGGYSLWADVSVSVSFYQSGYPTILLGVLMILVASLLIKYKCVRYGYEE